jgi:hypothetical protein
MPIKYSSWILNKLTFFNLRHPKFPPKDIFGLKVNHLAALRESGYIIFPFGLPIFMDIWYILWPFGVIIWYVFPFWYVVPEKFGNPGSGTWRPRCLLAAKVEIHKK